MSGNWILLYLCPVLTSLAYWSNPLQFGSGANIVNKGIYGCTAKPLALFSVTEAYDWLHFHANIWNISCFFHTHQLCAPHRNPSSSQRSEGHEGAENHPVWFRGFSQRPLHHTARDQGQVFLHVCLCQVAVQQRSGCWLWRCMVIICYLWGKTQHSLNFLERAVGSVLPFLRWKFTK